MDQLRIILNDYHPQVSCLNETWLKTAIPDSFVDINDYKLVRLDRCTKKTQGSIKRVRGLATYIQSSIKFECLDKPPFSDSTVDLEYLTIKIIRKCTRPLYNISIYRPPTGNLENMYATLTQLLRSFNNLDKANVVIGEDFIIDFAKIKLESAGTILVRRLSKRFSLEKQIFNQTCPLYRDSIIDQILTNIKFVKKMPGLLNINISDHTGGSYRNFNEN